MRVFVTGASGFVGSAVVQELLAAGHTVLGLARSDAAAAAIAALGAEVHRGSLEDLESLKRGALASDGVVHTAFSHDFSKFVQNSQDELRAVQALGDALTGTDRPLVVTSGVGFLNFGRVATEEDAVDPASGENPRSGLEPLVLSLAPKGVRVALVRLPPSVHGEGDKGFVPMLGGIAREHGKAAYIGEGSNLWPAVHRLDAARLFRLALERGASGARYHAVADEGVPVREIAEAIGRQLGVSVDSLAPDEVEAYYTWFAPFARLNCPASSRLTRLALGWSPTEPGLLADIDRPAYFKA